ncbi:MAG: DUF721 domain-containing protein [Nitrospirota bacterium]
MRKPSALTSVSAVLDGLAKRLGLESKLLEFHLRRRWPEIVGEQIAAHTRPDSIRFKKLYLLVENSVWLQQLTFLKPTLLEKINEAGGAKLVADLVLRVGEVGASAGQMAEGGRQHEELASPEPNEEVLAEAEAHAASVTDPELRARLTEVMAKALSPSRTQGASRPQSSP